MRQEPDIATHEDQGEPMEQVANWRAEDFDLDTTVMSCDFNLCMELEHFNPPILVDNTAMILDLDMW